jgi:hypothetical protein
MCKAKRVTLSESEEIRRKGTVWATTVYPVAIRMNMDDGTTWSVDRQGVWRAVSTDILMMRERLRQRHLERLSWGADP